MASKLNFDSVLIVTYGRSGSTLLQGVLNSIPGVLVRGENENFVFGLYQAYQRLTQAKANDSSSHVQSELLPTHPWYGRSLLDLDLFCNHCSVMVKELLLADHQEADAICYGFKEIRYVKTGKDFESYLQFLRKIFPNLCLIFNTRNLDDVLKSSWWARSDSAQTRQLLEDFESRFTHYVAENPQHSFQISYQDVVNKTERLEAMFQFLGADYASEVIDDVLSKRHSSITSTSVRLKNHYLQYVPTQQESYAGLLESVIVDGFPDSISIGQPFSLGGVAVPAQDQSVTQIVAISTHQVFEAKIGMKSPTMEKQYPQISASAKARFKFKDLVVHQPETIKLVAKMGNGQELEIADVHVMPNS